MRNRFGIKGRVVVDLAKRREYPILNYWHIRYLIPDRPHTVFAIRTRVQTFIKDGLWVQ